MRGGLRAGAVLVAGIILSSCTLTPLDSSPKVVAPSKVPFGLLSPQPLPQPPAPAKDSERAIWLLDAAGTPSPVTRRLALDGLLANVVESLILGPSGAEGAAGYSTDVASNVNFTSVTLSNHLVVIAMGTDLAIPGANSTVAAAQLVLTLTSIAGVNRVQIVENGQPVKFLLPNGTSRSIMVAKDFASLTASN
jgi:Sporulation and spore germination